MVEYALAIDVGGTFTDVVLSDLKTGELHFWIKVNALRFTTQAG